MKWAAAAAGLCLAACGSESKQQQPCMPGGDGKYVDAPYDKLSQYCMVFISEGEMAAQPGVTPYELNTPLFSDYAEKRRTVWMPAGKSAAYDPDQAFDFPTGPFRHLRELTPIDPVRIVGPCPTILPRG